MPIQIKFKYNSNFDWNSNSNYANIQTFDNTIPWKQYYIYFTIYTARKSYRKYGGEERSCIEILRFWMKGESESMTREKKCNIDWILESERMQNRRAHINSFDLLNRLIWMFKFQARSTQFARTPRLFNSFPSTIQTVLASTTTKPGQLAC